MKKDTKKGYAILFVMVIISIISAVTAGLANTTLKQSILSSVAKDSQSAFYASDTATECALYAHYNPSIFDTFTDGQAWICGADKNENPYSLIYKNNPSGRGYTLTPPPSLKESIDPCFSIETSTTTVGGYDTTTIYAKGYNFCKKDSSRSVERAIKAVITTIPE